MCERRTYNILSAGIFATFGITMVVLSLTFKEFASNRLDYLNQIADDWQKQPFVDIKVVKNYTCPQDYEEVFYKPWYGTRHMCACFGLWWEVQEGQCPYDDITDSRGERRSRDCYELPGLSPVIMNKFKGSLICGKRGGQPFLNVTRVEKNGKCPKGTVACGRGQSAENTVCYP